MKNWSGSVKWTPERVASPSSLDELASLMRDSSARGKSVRVVGTAHSFTPLVATDAVTVSLDNMQGIESVDAERREAVVLAGTKLWRLSPMLDRLGLAMENLGDINRQSLAGACSTGTHGTGERYGVIASQAEGMTLVTASGEILEISRESDPDLLRAAAVSLGSLGVIAKVRLRLLPAYNLHYVRKRETLDYAAERIDDFRASNRHFELFCFPHSPTGLLKFLNETDRPAYGRRLRKFFTDVVLENALFGAFSRACWIAPSLCPSVSRLCGKLVSEGEEVNPAHLCFSTDRMVRFQEMEYAVPAERGMELMLKAKKWIERSGLPVHFPLELRYVKQDDLWLSPANGRPTAFIATHIYNKFDHRALFEGVEKIFLEAGGRPHWGKLHTLDAESLAPRYPQWEAFAQTRRRLDPEGRFMNPYLRRVLGT